MSGPLPPALVLAAGLGTRLRPLTRVRAKPAAPVAGRPLITRVLEWLAAEGVTEAVVNLHHRPQTITRVVGHGQAAGVHVRYSWEPVILGSAGGPRHALPLLGERFFLVNGDTLTTIPLRRLAAVHARAGAAVTLAVVPHPAPERYGGVLVADDGRVRGFARAGGGAGAHFVGVQLVEAAVFAELPAGRPAATIGGLYDRLLAGADGGGPSGSNGPGRPGGPGGIHAHRSEEEFVDIGSPADYLAASLAVARREGQRALPIGAGSSVHPTAALERTAVWDHVLIGAGCRLVECIVADGVILPPGTVLQRQICVPAEAAAEAEAAETGAGGSAIGAPVGNAIATPFDGLPADGMAD